MPSPHYSAPAPRAVGHRAHRLLAVLAAALALAVPAFSQGSETCPDLGEPPTPVEVTVTAVPIVVTSTTDDYFVLYVKHDVNGTEVELPVLVKLGEVGTTTLAENVAALPAERYRVEKYQVADPADVDGDCTDDITELNDPEAMNPVSPAAEIDVSDGAITIPDRATFETLSYSIHGGEFVKFVIVDFDTDRPRVYLVNTNTHTNHEPFLRAIGVDLNDIWQPNQIRGSITFHAELTALGGGLGVYRYTSRHLSVVDSFNLVSRTHTLLAASMPLLEDNLAYWIRNHDLPRIQSELQVYRDSRINLLFDEDVFSEISFLALNSGEGYGLLRALDPDERPNSRDVVIYEALPNELSRVAGIISTVAQTPLSHVNLRAIQNRIPNAYIRDALDDPDIAPLIDGYVYYRVSEGGWELRTATLAEVEAHYESSRPAEEQVPQRDLSVTDITPLSQIGFADWDAFGVKAANLAELRKLGFPAGTVPDGFAIPFYFYDRFMTETALGQETVLGKGSGPAEEKITLSADTTLQEAVTAMLAHPVFQTDFEIQDEVLDDLRDAIEDVETPAWIIAAVEEMNLSFADGIHRRYRSSTNNEDLPGFNGAGLYDSKSQKPSEDEEDLGKSLKEVYASLWNFRAFTEREFHRIDHLAAAMGILVHPSFQEELVNGVAVSIDPAYSTEGTYYVNSQLGEDLITNPEAHSLPEEILLNSDGTYTVVANSNQIPRGQLLMSDDQLDQLRDHLAVTHDHFEKLYNPAPGEPFAMEIEFKITSDNLLAIKQARPWVFTEFDLSPSEPDTSDGVTATFDNPPATHDGNTFSVRIRFSESIIASLAHFRDHAFAATGGSVRTASRVERRGTYWEIRVEPDSDADVRLFLAANRPCTIPGAICTSSGLRLSTPLEHIVKGLDAPAPPPPPPPTPPPPPPPPPSPGGGGGGGGGGGLLFPPLAPARLEATARDGAVRLEWSPPESDGGSPIQRYEYRLKEGQGAFGEWTPIEDSAPDEVNATGYTVGDLGNGTVYAFELRGVNAAGNGRVSEAVEVVMPLDPTWWSNFRAEDLEGAELMLEAFFSGGDRELRFGEGLRFEEDELDGEGEVTATHMGSYGYRYTSRTTGVLSLEFDEGASCEVRLTLRGEGAGSYSYRCGGSSRGQGSFQLTGLNRAPEIRGAGLFEVVENTARVGQLEAVDSDAGDEITGYGVADGALFAIEAETGELTFREAPDYEKPGDVESADPASSAADNEYIVVVEATSGEGERERRRSRAIRVRVTDEEEAPGAPAAPEVTAEGTDSLKVSWREPENRGPAITDYEVRYREVGEAGYRDGGQEGTGLALTLTDLEEGTVYEVQVRAINEEGTGEWSEPGEGTTEREEPDPEDPANFTGEDLEGRRLRLRPMGEAGDAGMIELRFGEGNRFEQIESGGRQAATRSEDTASRSGSYAYQWTGPGRGRLSLTYDDGAFCEVSLTFTGTGVGSYADDCGEGDVVEGSFQLTTGSLFVPVILSSAGRNQSFFTSELTLTNRGDEEVRLDYTYTAHIGGGSGTASEVLEAGRQSIETDALDYLRGLGVPIPETGNRIGTLRVDVGLGSEVAAVVRTTTVVPEGRAGLAYLGVAEEEGFEEAVYLCGLRQNGQDRSNVAFQNMGAPGEEAITIRTTVYSGEAADTSPRELEDVQLRPGQFHQHNQVLGSSASGYVKVERVEGEAPFYAYGVINDQVNSDGSFVFPVTASWLEGKTGQTLPVIVETGEFQSELTVTNFSEDPRTLDFEFVSEQIQGEDKRVGFSMALEAGQQEIMPELVEALRREGMAGLGTSRGFYLGPLFAEAKDGDLSGIVIGARTGSEGGGGQYSVFYNAVPEGEGFRTEAWVEGLQQNEENRSNLALVNTGEVDDSPSVFHLEIYDGETGMLIGTVVTKPIPARSWHQINGILGRASSETRQGYIRILKVSGENPFLAYGVVNDGGAPGERSGDGAYLPAGE